MGARTQVDCADATWNPVRGCSWVSRGCEHCHAERTAARLAGRGQPYEGLVDDSGLWNGRVILVHHTLAHPLRWTRPRRVCVNSTGDLFHPGVPVDWVDRVFAVMALSPLHTFQISTKHPGRMLAYLKQVRRDSWEHYGAAIVHAANGGTVADARARVNRDALRSHPLPNVWVGVSVEDQASLDERLPILARTPAACRFVACEPLLGPLDFTPPHWRGTNLRNNEGLHELDWLIAGGESGPGARPMHVDWVRGLRDACRCRDYQGRPPLPFFFKSWGNWLHASQLSAREFEAHDEVFRWTNETLDYSVRMPKKNAGRMLDGRTWLELPPFQAAA
jgi:protein gp37